MMLIVTLLNVVAHGIELNVPFKPQVPPGTADFSETKNCGPTSVLMVAAYHQRFEPTEQHIRDIDDWMVTKEIISSVHDYNGEDTGWEDLVRIAKEYYGFKTITKHNNNDLSLLISALEDGNP
jgi:hypothetical protein